MIAHWWQHQHRASMQGDMPQTPYDGFQRSYRSIDGDGNWRPCAARGKTMPAPVPRGRRQHQGGWAALAILIILAVSILATLYYKHEYDVEHDRRIAAEANVAAANGQTKACNDSIAGLEQAAEQRGRDAEAARRDAADRRAKRNAKADKELSTPPSTPGNDCKSAQDRVHRILGARKTP